MKQWLLSKGEEVVNLIGVIPRAGKVFAPDVGSLVKCIANMSPNVKTKILCHSDSANVADVEDYAFLTDDLENIVLFSAFCMEENIS